MTDKDIRDSLLNQLQILTTQAETGNISFEERCAYANVMVSALHLVCQGFRFSLEIQQES